MKENPDYSFYVEALNNRGCFLMESGDFSSSGELFHRAENLMMHKFDTNLWCHVFLNLAAWNLNQAFFSEVVKQLNRIQLIARVFPIRENLALTLLKITVDLDNGVGNYALSQSAMKNIKQIHSISRNVDAEAFIHTDSVIQNIRLKKFEEAFSEASSLLGLAEKTGDMNKIADAYINVGMILDGNGKNFLAISMFRKAESIYKELNHRPLTVRAMWYRANAYNNAKEPDKALELVKQVSSDISQNELCRIQWNEILYIAHNQQHRFHEALQVIEESYHYYDRLGATPKVSKMLLKMGDSYYNLRDFSEARTKANNALGLAESIGELFIVEECKELLAALNVIEQTS